MSTKSNISKITIDIPKNYHKKLKSIAALCGISMRQLLVQAIKEICESSDDNHSPNEETMKTIQNIEKNKKLIKCKDASDLFKKLGL